VKIQNSVQKFKPKMVTLIPYTPILVTTDRGKILIMTFILVSIFSLMQFILLTMPPTAIRLVTKTGKQLASITRNIVTTTVEQSGKALNLASNVIKDVSKQAVKAMSTMTSSAMAMIQHLAELIQQVPRLLSKWAKTATKTMSDVIKKTADITRNLIKTLADLSKETVEFIQQMLKQAVDMYGDLVKAMSVLVDEVFTPAMRRLLKLPADLARSIAAATKKSLPLIVNGVKMLAERGLNQVLKDCFETSSTAFTVAQYAKTACNFITALTGGDTFTVVLIALQTYIGQTKPSFGQFFNKCFVITYLINLFLDKTIGSILPGFLKTCQPDVIRSGLNWFSKQKICKTKPKNKVYLKTVMCFLQSIGTLTLIPAFEIKYGAFVMIDTLAKIPGIPNPLKWVIDQFFGLTKRLPSITFGWKDISIKSLLNGATGILAEAMGLIGFVAFSALKGLQINFSGKFPTPIPNPALAMTGAIINLYVYLMRKIIPILLEMFKSLSSRVVALVNRWNICTPRFCINLLFTKVCAPRICVGDVVGGLSKIIELIMDLAIKGIEPLFQVADMMGRLIGVGDSSNFEGLDKKLEQAFQNISGKLPFYVKFSTGF